MQGIGVDRVKEFLHYGEDHLIISLFLFDRMFIYFENEPERFYATYDSAAYLANLGIELILKA